MNIKNLTKEELEKLQEEIKEEIKIKSMKFKVDDKVLIGNEVVTIIDIDTGTLSTLTYLYQGKYGESQWTNEKNLKEYKDIREFKSGNFTFKVDDDGFIEVYDRNKFLIRFHAFLDTLYEAVDKSKELRGLK